MISFFKFLSGYCYIRICGEGKERFLNLCRNKKILIWNLKRQGETYLFYVSYKGYRLLHEISEKTNTKIQIEGKYGLPFFLYRNRKRTPFFLGFLFCFVLLYGCTFFLWNIQVIGTEQYTKEEIIEYLKEKEIGIGTWKYKIKCSQLEEIIREDFNETAWVSCNLEGTQLTVHLKESIPIGKEEEKEREQPNDLVALKDGVIHDIITRNGTPLVKKGDQVKKGDILISGIIYLYNDYDELLETYQVSAEGEVSGITTYSYEDSFPLNYYEKEYTGKSITNYDLYLGSFSIPFHFKKVPYKDYDLCIEKIEPKLFSSLYLPFSVDIVDAREYNTVSKSMNRKEALKKADEKIDFFVKQTTKDGAKVVDQQFERTITDEKCIIKGFIKVVEPIGKIRNIS